MANKPLSDGATGDLSDVQVELKRLDDLAKSVGSSLSNALRGAALDGKSLRSVLADVSRAFADIALKAALKPLGDLITGAVGNLFKALDPPLLKPFAKGGVIASPTYFPMSGGMGLAGEAGPEAVVPLARGSDGKLGLAGGGATVNVNFNVTASDARSFAASEAEISAMLLRAVKRGTRAS